MPNMGWDDFDENNGEKYEALSQEQLNRDKIAAVFRNFIKENIYKNLQVSRLLKAQLSIAGEML